MPPLLPDGIEQRHVTARDGTRLGYQVSNPTGRRTIVLANGLGGTYPAFKYLYQVLGDYRTVCWDYRGLYSSGTPKTPSANTMAHHVDDLVDILAAEQIDDFVIVGWSMGVQVALETIRHHKSRVRGVLATNGTYGHTFHTVMGSRLMGQVIPLLLKLVRAQAGLVGAMTKRVAGSDGLINAMKRVGLVSETIDMDVFRTIAGQFQNLDWVIYSDMLQQLDVHDAEAVLATIDVPFTILTGDKDLMTPPSTAEHMHRTIPGSRLVVVDGGTHYMPVEYPAILVDEMGRLLDRVPGWERTTRAA